MNVYKTYVYEINPVSLYVKWEMYCIKIILLY